MSANYSICIGTIGTGAWLSPDGGDSWRRIASPNGLWGESRVYGLATHPSEPRTIFAGADDGEPLLARLAVARDVHQEEVRGDQLVEEVGACVDHRVMVGTQRRE